MGWNDRLDYDLQDLPAEAWDGFADRGGPFQPVNSWIESAPRSEQKIALVAWFRSRYAPALFFDNEYLFSDGGPYDPFVKIKARFNGLVNGALITEVAEELVADHGPAWSRKTEPVADGYDDRFELRIVEPSDPMYRLQTRIDEIDMILDKQTDPPTKAVVRKLVYGSLIGILEAFLWETAQYWILSSKDVLRACVATIPQLKDQKITLAQAFEKYEGIEQIVKAHLQNVVWHRWEQVGPIYKHALGVDLPSFKAFDEATAIRHHIVHRNGTDHDGNEIFISDELVDALRNSVLSFGRAATDACEAKFDPSR